MKKHSPDNIKEILKSVVKKLDKREQEEADIYEIWEKVAGKRAAKHSKPSSIKAGRMLVNVSEPAWLYELTLGKRKLTEWHGQVMKLVTGIMLASFGILFLTNYKLLENVVTPILLLVSSLVATAIISIVWKKYFVKKRKAVLPKSKEKVNKFEKEFLEYLEVKHSKDILLPLKEGKLTDHITETLEEVAKDIADKYESGNEDEEVRSD